MARIHSKVELDVQRGELPGDAAVYIQAVQKDGRLTAECRSLAELDEQIKWINTELQDLRQQASKIWQEGE